MACVRGLGHVGRGKRKESGIEHVMWNVCNIEHLLQRNSAPYAPFLHGPDSVDFDVQIEASQESTPDSSTLNVSKNKTNKTKQNIFFVKKIFPEVGHTIYVEWSSYTGLGKCRWVCCV